MFEDEDHPLPDRKTLREMIRKARALEPFNEKEVYWNVNIMVTLERDSFYRLTERLRERDAEDGS